MHGCLVSASNYCLYTLRRHHSKTGELHETKQGGYKVVLDEAINLRLNSPGGTRQSKNKPRINYSGYQSRPTGRFQERCLADNYCYIGPSLTSASLQRRRDAQRPEAFTAVQLHENLKEKPRLMRVLYITAVPFPMIRQDVLLMSGAIQLSARTSTTYKRHYIYHRVRDT